ncbi:hypothetical protein J1M35_12875 [Ottowia testudinis]|uniref:50S ribosomal protein L25 n=1 Tax=Ottowia testudinis TaxID=2816950 RepID=A0A975H5F2_9BURK|nr:hypothetical protein J1M35_12875 [Ottowia testudinis]
MARSDWPTHSGSQCPQWRPLHAKPRPKCPRNADTGNAICSFASTSTTRGNSNLTPISPQFPQFPPQFPQAIVEPGLAKEAPEDRFQFERHGFFVADRSEHVAGEKLAFNRVTGLKDSWAN